ncbi:MAG: class I SAM-dependent methyltransferase [Pseudomonadota bacterium]|nr:class I SAM-dependent methyltransferase [Pseudomonadota bacterium]
MTTDQPENKKKRYVTFGERNVPADEKEALVRQVFNSVASRYDIMNDLMSGGLHRRWKRRLVRAVLEYPVHELLDLAGGSGDIALSALQRNPNQLGRITVCDINLEMLMVGQKRAWNSGYLNNLHWTCGNGEQLPFSDAHFDVCTLSFGLRNMTHPELALAEIYRVLKPGGRLLLLEFTPDIIPALQGFYNLYSSHIIPFVARRIMKDAEPYNYLVESIRRFYRSQQITTLLRSRGFVGIRARALTGGIASLHSAWRS